MATKEITSVKDILEYSRLNANAVRNDIIALCNEAKENEIFGICVPPYHLSTAKDELVGTNIKLITVCGFPFGYTHTSSKVESVKRSIQMGADEVDVVVNFAAVKSGDWSFVQNDISSVNTVCKMQDKIAKIILEVSLLNEEELKRILDICVQEEVNHVKTGTGLMGNPVTPEQVRYLLENGPDNLIVKATGGIDTKKKATDLVKAGAQRLGSSNGLKLI